MTASRPEGAKGKAREVVLRVGGDEHATPYIWESAIATALEEYAREQVGAAWLDADVQRSFAAKDKATDTWRALFQRAEARTQDCLRELAEVRAQLQTLRGENDELWKYRAWYAQAEGEIQDLRAHRTTLQKALLDAKAQHDQVTQEKAALEARLGLMGHRACPCVHTTPCDPMCTCVNQFSSRGCARCCSYGSKEQQRAAAEHLVSLEARERALRKAIVDAIGFVSIAFASPHPECDAFLKRMNDALAPRRG